MQTLKIYIETSVWSFVFTDDAPEYQADTIAFFELCKREVFEPYISRVGLTEIQHAKAPLRKRLEELIRDIKPLLLPASQEANSLSEAFIRENVVPASRPEDA